MKGLKTGIITTICLLAACQGQNFTNQTNKSESQKTNIIFLFIDYMGWKELSCYGGKLVETIISSLNGLATICNIILKPKNIMDMCLNQK